MSNSVDLSSLLSAGAASRTSTTPPPAAKKSGNTLDMDDFLMLMVTQFQNQTIDNTADSSDMLNQLVQMSVVQAVTNITDAAVMMYAGSLVGKEVTVGQYNNGKLEEIVGVVTGTGVAGGQQVIFVNGKSYYLSDIMAVGRLPEKPEPEKPEGGGDGEVKPDGGNGEVKPDGGETKPPEGGGETKPETPEPPPAPPESGGGQ